MKTLDQLLGWSPPRDWPLDRDASAVPEDIRPGMWIRCNLIGRAEWLTECRDRGISIFIQDHVWKVENGDGFRFIPLGKHGRGVTHMVAGSYRVWSGELEVEPLLQDTVDELSDEHLEAAMRLLMGGSRNAPSIAEGSSNASHRS